MQRRINKIISFLINQPQNKFATKMQASSTNNTKDSAGRRLGVKKLGGMEVFPGDILVRQRGMKWHAGENTYVGKDHTIHSKIEGTVYFTSFQQNFHRGAKSIIHVRPQTLPNRYVMTPKPHNYHPELFPQLALYNWQPTNYQINKKKFTPKLSITTFQIDHKPQYFNQLDLTYLQQCVQKQEEIKSNTVVVDYALFCEQYIDKVKSQLNLENHSLLQTAPLQKF